MQAEISFSNVNLKTLSFRSNLHCQLLPDNPAVGYSENPFQDLVYFIATIYISSIQTLLMETKLPKITFPIKLCFLGV